jgi:hypothetical protein
MIANLEYKIKEQNDYVASLVKENRELRKVIETTKSEKPSEHLEGNIIRLQKEIATLKNENKELEEKNQVLKAALLLHVDVETTEVTDTKIEPIPAQVPKEPKTEIMTDIPAGKVQDIVNQKHVAMERSEGTDIGETEKLADVPKGMVQELIKKRHKAMETREAPIEFPEPTIEIPKPIIEPPSEQISKEKEVPTSPPEEVSVKSGTSAEEIPDIDEIGVIETSDGRRKCPICGNENLRQIREVEDKTKIISAYPRMYGKKFKCGQCGAEWR